MKQAVKFDNFNLSLEQMGTFLAFAQQQAKDTGQDVNFLVDSIVGLGRKSLPIPRQPRTLCRGNQEPNEGDGRHDHRCGRNPGAHGGSWWLCRDSRRPCRARDRRLDNAMKELGDTMN